MAEITYAVDGTPEFEAIMDELNKVYLAGDDEFVEELLAPDEEVEIFVINEADFVKIV